MNLGSPVKITPPSHLPAPGQSQAAARSGKRRVWVILAAGLALVVAGAGAWKWSRGGGSPLLQGAVLTPPVPAYDFHLPDQDGRTVSLSGLRGKVVALTFLYTHCPDVCPLIADTLHQVYRQLGDLAGRVAFVAVSVDPSGDTPAAVREFLATHHVQDELTYLRGSPAQLRPVWSHYYVQSDATDVHPGAQQVGHTAVLYIIDPGGKIDVFLPANFDPKDLLTDLRLLAARNR